MTTEEVNADRASDTGVLRQRVAELSWYHTYDLAPGVETPGLFDLRPYVDRYGLPERMDGLRALDVGTFDGFWAFEMERRGAAVTALDIDRTQQMDWPPRLRPAEDEPRGQTFRLVHEVLGSSVERVGCSIYDATPDKLGGTFDIVFCGSVLIHLRDPMLALERMAGLCHGQLLLTEEYSKRLEWLRPVQGVEFRGNSPWMTWWRPTSRTWREMVHCAGFDDIEQFEKFPLKFRAQRGSVPHVGLRAKGPAQRSAGE